VRNNRGARKLLLVLVCEHDQHSCSRLFKRITQLQGWALFDRLLIHIDCVMSQTDVAALAAEALRHGVTTDAFRLTRPGEWQRSRAEAMLKIYQAAIEFDLDIVRLDPDIYISDEHFIQVIRQSYGNIAGKLMNFFLPIKYDCKQLDFVQGGVTLIGHNGRAYINQLTLQDLQDYRQNYMRWMSELKPGYQAEYDYYLLRTEDVILSGVLAIRHGVTRDNVPGLQVSPYDVLRDHRSNKWEYADFIRAFEASGALSYHFEGGHSDRRQIMTQMLDRYYNDRDCSLSKEVT
jgi:hypothetical protein